VNNEDVRHLVSITHIRDEAGGEVVEVAFRGSVRSHTVDIFRDSLERAGENAPYLLVNLAELEYLSSTGLGVMLQQSRRQEKRNGWMRIVSPSATVTMILGLSGVSDILASAGSPEEALRDLPHAA